MRRSGFIRRNPWLISLLLVIGLTTWIVSGSIGQEQQDSQQLEQEKDTPLPRVRTETLQSQPIKQTLKLYGRTEPDRHTVLRAEISGRVVEVLAQRGERVSRGTPLLRIALDDRREQLESARAQYAQHLLEYKGAESLSTKGYQGKTELAQRNAQLKQTEALIARLRRDIDNAIVRAPYDGIVVDRETEIGEYVSVGDPLVSIADLNPVIVRGDVSQAKINSISTGQSARVNILTIGERQGRIRYLSPISDANTNTFRIEVAVENDAYRILGGVTAEIQLQLEQIHAIKITPALLSLDEKGEIGVKWVKQDRVQFTPIDIVKTEADGIWISGLEDQVQLITVGQGFVREGDSVEVDPERDGDS